MKILITGGSGLLGQYLNIILSESHDIFSLYNSNTGNCNLFPSENIDLKDHDKLKDIFNSFLPDVVIHTAAISRPEQCDSLPREFVLDINVRSTCMFAELCDTHNAKLIFTSTDLVYDGDSGQMLDEQSGINPVSLYAQTKLQSENEISRIFDNYIILRTSLLFGMGLNHSVNNFHQMLFNFRNKKPVRLFHDQYRTPLALSDAALLISDLIRFENKNIVLNFGGRERVSRVQLGELLCELGNFDSSLIESISMSELPGLHKVADVSMNTDRLQSLGLKQKSLEESIVKILERN